MKTCPQCGAEQALDAKFCTKCGYQFAMTAPGSAPDPASQPAPSQPSTGQPGPTPASAPTQPNENLEKAKALGKSYWAWLVAGFKHPGRPVQASSQWFGLLSIGLIGLFNMIAVIRPLANTVNSVGSSLSSSVGGLFSSQVQEASSTASSAIFGTGFRMLILFIVIGIALATSAWLGKRVISGAASGYLEGLTEFAYRISPALLLSAIAAVIGLLSGLMGLPLILLLIGAEYALQNIAFFQMALTQPTYRGMDPQYSLFLITMLTGIVNIILFMLFGSSLFDMLGNL